MLYCKRVFRQYSLCNIHTKSSIVESYQGKSVFVTGGTGFMGKVVLEKLLYRCQGIDKLYVLVREKINIKPHQRLVENMLNGPVFARLRNERPQALDKIIPIVGDITEARLGVNAEDERVLINAVSFVFHIAANIRFHEKLDVAINYNVAGTERVLDLCQRMKTIKCLVYVSTAYTNLDRDVIDEILYPPPAPLSEVRAMIENGMTDEKVKRLMTTRSNTYTFTKALAENVIAEKHGNIPAVIVRPSIVGASNTEPVDGWIDSWAAATGVVHIMANGTNRVMHSKSTNIIDLIPVDYVCNLIIVAAARCDSTSKEVPVFNSSTSGENPITYGLFRKLILADSYKNKAYIVPFPFVYYTGSKWIVSLITLVSQTIPAFVADAFLSLRGKKPRYRKMFDIVVLSRDVGSYITSHSWVIRASKTRALAQSLSATDKKYFPFDPKDIDWNKYMPTYCKGIRKYLAKSEK